MLRKGLLEKIDRSAVDLSEHEQEVIKSTFKSFDIDSTGSI